MKLVLVMMVALAIVGCADTEPVSMPAETHAKLRVQASTSMGRFIDADDSLFVRVDNRPERYLPVNRWIVIDTLEARTYTVYVRDDQREPVVWHLSLTVPEGATEVPAYFEIK